MRMSILCLAMAPPCPTANPPREMVLGFPDPPIVTPWGGATTPGVRLPPAAFVPHGGPQPRPDPRSHGGGAGHLEDITGYERDHAEL